MSIDASSFAPGRPVAPDAIQRLGAALLASVVLHAMALAWPEARRSVGRLPHQARPTPMLASLMRPQAKPDRPPAPPPDTDVPVSVGPKVGADDTPLSVKARFATPPDLSILETVPLVSPLTLRLRIQVTPQGRAERIDIVESLRVPADFLAAVTEALSAARFIPGATGGTSVGSGLELVIEASPTETAAGPGLLFGPPRVTPPAR